jgi:aminoglycoside phosphotransferase (APT) family kinase protein
VSDPAPPPWTPEITVDPDVVAQVVADQFPELAGLLVRPVGVGWDNSVFGVGPDWVFRFIHRQAAVRTATAELAVLRALPDLPLPVPRPLLVGTPTPELPFPFWGAHHLPGTEIGAAGVPDDARGPVAHDVGTFLRRLHDPALAAATVDAVGRAGVELGVDPMSRAVPRAIAPRARATIGRLVEAGRWAPDPAVRALLDEAEPLGPTSGTPVLVHGDLHVRHLLVTTTRGPRASGVIDWGDTCLGDPAVDLAIAFMAFVGSARESFLTAYGPVDAERALRARTLAVHLAALLADQAIGDGMPVVAAEALAALGRAVR